MWDESLNMAVRAGPKHISVYDLHVEQGTKFGLWYQPGEYPLPSEDESATFYRRASEALREAGYNHYEISSYCKDGYEKHNLAYWQNKSFHGFGLGSASYLGGVRFSTPRRMKVYLAYVEGLEIEPQCEELVHEKIVDAKDLAKDVVMLSLRTARGVDVKEFEGDFGRSLLSLCEALRPYVRSGHVVGMDEKGRELGADEFGLVLFEGEDNQQEIACIRLSDPDGFLLSNELISTAFGAMSP